MKTNRQLHLWIGLLTSILVLVESVTGLMLAEPQLMGMSSGKPTIEQRMLPQQSTDQSQATLNASRNAKAGNTANANATTNADSGANATTNANGNSTPANGFDGARGARGNGEFKGRGQQSSLMGIVKGLHAGRIGNTDVGILADITAVALIILTVTGIILSVKILAAQSRAKKRAAVQN